MSAGMFDTGYTVQPGIMVQRARETSGTSASRLSRTSCKSWLLPFLLRRALPDIPEQYMRALQDPRMCIVQRGLSRSTQARAERICHNARARHAADWYVRA